MKTLPCSVTSKQYRKKRLVSSLLMAFAGFGLSSVQAATTITIPDSFLPQGGGNLNKFYFKQAIKT